MTVGLSLKYFCLELVCFRVHLEKKEHLGTKDPLVLLDYQVKEGPPENMAPKEEGEILGCLVQRGHKESKVNVAHKESEALKAPLESWEVPEIQDHLDLQESLEQQE
jgi:hypothetical protein